MTKIQPKKVQNNLGFCLKLVFYRQWKSNIDVYQDLASTAPTLPHWLDFEFVFIFGSDTRSKTVA